MFRNPRDKVPNDPGTIVLPSVGRPPSPPSTPEHYTRAITYKTAATLPITGTMSSRTATATGGPLPTIGRQGPTPRKSSSTTNGFAKAKGKPNASILTFFKKAEPVEEELFVPGKATLGSTGSHGSIGSGLYDEWEDRPHIDSAKETEDGQDLRFQENGRSIKRRRIGESLPATTASNHSPEDVSMDSLKDDTRSVTKVPDQEPTTKCEPNTTVPFMEDSDSESEAEETKDASVVRRQCSGLDDRVSDSSTTPAISTEETSALPDLPHLKREATSFVAGGDFDDFENAGDFEEDIYDEGEEFVERQWMEEEQRRLEEEDGDLEADHGGLAESNGSDTRLAEPGEAPTCPICSVNLGGVPDRDAAVHVNNCLDGNPTPLLVKKEPVPIAFSMQKEGSNPAKRFIRPPKPGQENPFSLGGPSTKSGGSAFSKLMSGHAEDAAWATAAAAEHAARGKPAYQRTCPFYKILPGFSIAVDAFRYGAVEGQKAYFLSHFHSDHYIGLTSSWSHGPIYCSKVTANLVKQQLRVDPKWVIALEFEKKVEVPGTGVDVTMIPANHCPGSSLYLFEKVVGKGKTPKVQRVLHCGDFRACRAHIEHPLLRPDVLDTVSGKERQQKLDVCYLDTTYLNPKYAFPSQEEVIKACADMCVSLNKIQADETDGWEQMKRERAGAGMVKFVHKESDPAIKKEEEDDDDIDAMKSTSKSPRKSRGKLLVIVGTYSIGKERICLGIARALKSKIYAPAGKLRICAALEDPELASLLTKDPREAQVHMTPLFEIRAETLDDYLKDYKDYFSRAVGFRPSGWNYRPPNSRFVESPSVQTVLHSDNWKSTYSMKELVPQRGSTSRASCFGVPYSEHSSFRELTMFCTALRIDKIIPTVNVGSAKSREKMKGWCEKWANEKKKNGLYRPEDGRW